MKRVASGQADADGPSFALDPHVTAKEPNHDEFVAEMTERLAYFRGRPTTEKGAAALAEFEQTLGIIKLAMARARGETIDAGTPRRAAAAAPVGAVLISDD